MEGVSAYKQTQTGRETRTITRARMESTAGVHHEERLGRASSVMSSMLGVACVQMYIPSEEGSLVKLAHVP